jgi:hypothetical protein
MKGKERANNFSNLSINFNSIKENSKENSRISKVIIRSF